MPPRPIRPYWSNGECKVYHGDCLQLLSKAVHKQVQLVIGSPPYPEKGKRYLLDNGKSEKWASDEWIEWMIEITTRAVAACNGYVVWVVNGAVREGRYLPACEGLVWKWYCRGGWSDRSLIWTKNAPPNRRDYFGNDWEYVLVFKDENKGELTFNWKDIGTPPKYTKGGRFRQRDSKGQRKLGSEYPTNPVTRPRDVLRFTVGGGHMGSKLAHQNEAPYPESLCEHLVKAFTNPGDKVLDPFCGSGTTLAVANRLGRQGIGIDNRESQVKLTIDRVLEATRKRVPKG